MSDTPETDAKSFIALDREGRKLVVVLAATSKSIERERDEAREQNTKLRDIAENAIYELSSWDDGKYSSTSTRLRAELDQLKEETK